jgi:ribosomal-protein-alanine N-acetyltransferase
VAGGEAELLTLAVDPPRQGRGTGGRLVARFLAEAGRRGAARAFLEVAEDNAAARALYARAGFAVAGRRPGYYRHPDGRRIDALVMGRDLPAS